MGVSVSATSSGDQSEAEHQCESDAETAGDAVRAARGATAVLLVRGPADLLRFVTDTLEPVRAGAAGARCCADLFVPGRPAQAGVTLLVARAGGPEPPRRARAIDALSAVADLAVAARVLGTRGPKSHVDGLLVDLTAVVSGDHSNSQGTLGQGGRGVEDEGGEVALGEELAADVDRDAGHADVVLRVHLDDEAGLDQGVLERAHDVDVRRRRLAGVELLHQHLVRVLGGAAAVARARLELA